MATHRAATALDGEGARKMGGRWNPQGAPVAYLTEFRALAALEIMVHFGRDVLGASWSVIEAEVSDDMIDSPSLRKLPSGWNDLASSSVSQKYGGRWIAAGKGLAMRLPSAIIPEEHILMLNVKHPDFAKVKVSKPRPFLFDHRLG
ncbi:MAG: RES family NAD+ phosphorylase [Luteolibacter sp.]